MECPICLGSGKKVGETLHLVMDRDTPGSVRADKPCYFCEGTGKVPDVLKEKP